jgi:peptidyl-prolyl cis-trans isomerase D
MDAVFGMAVGEVRVVSGDGAVVLVRLDAIADADDSPEATGLALQIAEQINQSLAQNIFAIYAADVVQRADPQIDPRAVQAVHVNFP